MRTQRSRLFGVLGDPIDHSLSPAMHNAGFAALGLPHVYLRFRVPPPALPRALDEARRLGMGGLNLTVPLKAAALPLVDALTPAARRIGAVNTLVFRGARLVGDNTDGRGFLRSLGRRVRLRGAAVVVIGAGGSAHAVSDALVGAGVGAVTIANRTPARAAELAGRLAGPRGLRVHTTGLEALATGDALAGAVLVVNTTSAALHGGTLRVRHGATPRRCLFADLGYGRRPTPFLAAAARAGRPTLDGAGMLLFQGALAFEAWTARRAPLAAMTDALRGEGLPLSRVAPAGRQQAARPRLP